ncbi:MAG: tetraacyldisaccharide 4'-kinase [Desulfobacterales bacterium]
MKPFLFAISIFYGGLIKLREALYKKGVLQSKRLPCPVVSIGNITVGGTGKTPMTLYVTELIRRFGYKVAIVSRGYKGKAEKTGGVVCDGRKICMEPDQAGDEPFMMAKKLRSVPVIVGKDRFKAGMLAVKEFNPDVVLLDDGFQHLRLYRDIDLVLLDFNSPFGNGNLLPRGILREPASSLSRADALILTRSDSAPGSIKANFLDRLMYLSQKRSVYITFHAPYIYKVIKADGDMEHIDLSKSRDLDSEIIKGRKVFTFSGIARNEDFKHTVESFGCDVSGFAGFPDHHKYSDEDINKILRLAKDAGAEIVCTTEKDYARMGHSKSWPIDLVIIGIEIAFGDYEATFNAYIQNRLSELEGEVSE